MASISISREVLYQQPDILDEIYDYFDYVTELVPYYPNTGKFEVQSQDFQRMTRKFLQFLRLMVAN